MRKDQKRRRRFTQLKGQISEIKSAAQTRAHQQRHRGRTRTQRTNAENPLIEEQLTHRILGAFYHVYDRLGFGFLESVYRRALAHELEKRGMRVEAEVTIEVWYEGLRVGDFRADLLVDQKVVVEVKASHLLSDSDWKQLLNYLRATELEIGLLCHFGPKAAFKRLIYSNTKKAEHLPT